MFQRAIQNEVDNIIQNITNFVYYITSFVKRNNLFEELVGQFLNFAKDFFTMNKKLKMARYRVNYQMYKLNQMEQLIAENNEHVFLKGQNLNQTR